MADSEKIMEPLRLAVKEQGDIVRALKEKKVRFIVINLKNLLLSLKVNLPDYCI